MSAYVPWRRVDEAVTELCTCGGDGPETGCTACKLYHRLKDRAIVFRGSGMTWTERATEEDLAT